MTWYDQGWYTLRLALLQPVLLVCLLVAGFFIALEWAIVRVCNAAIWLTDLPMSYGARLIAEVRRKQGSA